MIEFVAAGCNRQPHVLDAKDDLIVWASAADRGGRLFQIRRRLEEEFSAVEPFAFASGRINCVRILDDEHILTASSDGQLMLLDGKQSRLLHQSASTSILGCAGVNFKGALFVVWFDSRGTVQAIVVKNDSATPVVLFNGHLKCLVTSIGLLSLNSDHMLLSIATTDRRVRVGFVQMGECWKESFSLQGHSDWITSQEWTRDQASWLLATGSRDKTVRVWRLHSVGIDSGVLQELIPSKMRFGNDCPVLAGWQITCEAILYGHEGSVSQVVWDLTGRLASSSADQTVIIWKRSPHWMNQSQLGILSANDSNESFWSVAFAGPFLITHCNDGSIEGWREDDGGTAWTRLPRPLSTGHFGPVEGLAWLKAKGAGDGELLSCSKDQTTRLWKRKGCCWFEAERPQIHGYDLKCIAAVNEDEFISGADEKVLRVFRRPSGKVLVPVLGLSNKEQPDDALSTAGTRLWPESDKLYGHGHELFSLAVSSDGLWAVSGCKANNPIDAAPRLWSRCDSGWKAVAFADQGPTLTCTSIAFSPDNRHILIGSRDRSWSLYHCGGESLRLLRRQTEAHGRLIWAVGWLDEETFVTGSRDGTLKVWTRTDHQSKTLTFETGVTALAISNGRMAVGLESGVVAIIDCTDFGCIATEKVASLAITALAWAAPILAVGSEDCSVTVIRID